MSCSLQTPQAQHRWTRAYQPSAGTKVLQEARHWQRRYALRSNPGSQENEVVRASLIGDCLSQTSRMRVKDLKMRFRLTQG